MKDVRSDLHKVDDAKAEGRHFLRSVAQQVVIPVQLVQGSTLMPGLVVGVCRGRISLWGL